MTDLAPGTRMAEWLEQAWLDRYLARQLKPEESDWFEAYMLDKADLLEQVDADTHLRDAIAPSRLAATAPNEALAPPLDRTDSTGSRVQSHEANRSPHPHVVGQAAPARPRQLARVSWLQHAAVAVVAVALGWLSHSRIASIPEPSLLEGNPTRILFTGNRGSGATSRVENPGSRSRMVVVDISVPIGASNVRYRTSNGSPFPLEVASDGTVSILMPRDVAAREHEIALLYEIGGEEKVLVLPLAVH